MHSWIQEGLLLQDENALRARKLLCQHLATSLIEMTAALLYAACVVICKNVMPNELSPPHQGMLMEQV